MSEFIDDLTKNNEAPILFVGSGITKRYIENSPDWHELLKSFWDKLDFGNSFYGQLNIIKSEIDKESIVGDVEKEFLANIKIASMITDRFVEYFNKELITINDFTPEDSYKKGICPFKMAISNEFRNYDLKNEKQNEIQAFRNLVKKSQFIITTNYDDFIENLCKNKKNNENLVKYVGANGFFSQTENASEIYKIHGCVEYPNEIIIDEKDYSEFGKKEILVSAKIVSMLMDNPIVFLGYSLTDLNIRNIIKNVSAALSDDEIKVFSKRVAIVEWKPDERNILEEIVDDRDLGVSLRVIKTDNYEELFNRLSSINQGMSMSLVRKFKSKIKILIDDRAKEGALETVLISEKDIDEIDVNKEKNLVIALGTDKLVFQIPNSLSYCIDYISEKDEIPTEIKLRFLCSQNSTTRLPVNRVLTKKVIERSSLYSGEKEKLLQRIRYVSDFNYHFKKISQSQVFIETENLELIIKEKKGKIKTYETIAYNIERLDLEKVKAYILNSLEKMKDEGDAISTSFRKLLLLYDIVKCKRDNAEPY